MKSKRIKKEINRLKRQALGNVSMLKKNAKQNVENMTWPERKFSQLLKELNVKFETQKVIKDKIFDFYIPSVGLIVEVDGVYWHGHPEKFEKLNGLQKKNQRNDIYKDGLANVVGYSIERVWESDLKENYDKVKDKFKKLIKGEN